MGRPTSTPPRPRINWVLYHGLLKKDAELQATAVSSNLHAIAARMSELAKSSLIVNTLRGSTGKERFLIPYLMGIQRIHDIPVDILFADFEGREIARFTGHGCSGECAQ